MNDRELLEYAAKSFFSNGPIHISNSGFMDWVNDTHGAWNPLTDDGDALRLAVKLHIGIMSRSDFTMTWQYCKNNTDVTVEHKDNPESATRRAIVRAAAFIGKSK